MSNQFLFILCGEAFSGKTTLAKILAEKYNAIKIGRDDIYFTIEKLLAAEEVDNPDDSIFKKLWPLAIEGVKNHLLLGRSIVFDDNCLYLNQRDELRLIAEKNNVKSFLIFLDIPKEVLKERKEKNKATQSRHNVPSAWLDEDTKTFERPLGTENPIVYKVDDDMEEFVSKIDSF